MDKKYAVNIAKKFSSEVKKLLPVDKIVLFGSFAKGTNHKWSDIDIAVVVKNTDFDFFDMYQKLGNISLKIDTRIETLIIDRTKDYSGFLKTINNEGIVIYS